jgi:hypothetical protein
MLNKTSLELYVGTKVKQTFEAALVQTLVESTLVMLRILVQKRHQWEHG